MESIVLEKARGQILREYRESCMAYEGTEEDGILHRRGRGTSGYSRVRNEEGEDIL